MEQQHSKSRVGQVITVFATFLAFMGIGVVDPILPEIAAQIGASHWQVEMLFTSYLLMMAIMMIPAGILASRFGDKRLMVTGLIIVTIFAALCGLSNNIPQLSIFRAGWGLGNSFFFATAMTLLIALSGEVKQAVGMYEAAIGLGMAGGPLVGGVLGSSSWRLPFIGTSILIFIAFILVLTIVKQPGSSRPRKAAGFKDIIQLYKCKPFTQGALSGMLYYYGFFTVLAYTPLILPISALQIGFVFFGWGLCLAYGSAILAHKLEMKYPPKQVLHISLIIFAVILALLFVTDNTALRIILVMASGLVSGLNNALFTSYVMEVSPYERGITSGGYNFLRWLGAAFAPLLSGVIGHAIAPQAPFLVAAIIAVVAFVIMKVKVKKV
ncbi:MFS transporter [Priestia flexa]|uniref:MFS transporter n=2 Tax=Priestia flexa TaxID=86664 RepID=UPI00077C88B4|nr:MFS transporter [Priestia flexa]AQX54920.1 MFS transporter [Priestia flexa]MBN8434388.1 MFS transporter [Priestia flexa]MCA0966828.1 MFS transporter [Priestia flexa]MED3824842.1 MFS transporter [Priestia flexa]MED4590947.1 MFS transporter [Priestia flexa]